MRNRVEFARHLDRLYEFTKPDLSNTITADQILIGMRSSKPLNFEEQFIVASDLLKQFENKWHGKVTDNIVFVLQRSRCEDFFLTLQPELQIYFGKKFKKLIK